MNKSVKISKKTKETLLKKYSLVLVHWVDIVSEVAWGSPKDAEEMILSDVHEVGWVLKHNKDVLILTSQVNKCGATAEVGNRTIIPCSVIRKIDILLEKKQ